ncbi:MAG: SPFH domain-containing protein [Ruminococcaceae bacterium]|nr:SPFH domain-containing protein [Oscillospiraceae bacterium]
MGLIKAAFGAAGGVMADQWKEFFICESLPNDVLMRKGQKKTTGRSSNYKGDENIITSGSGIVVADGQCMIIVEQGKVVEVCAEPGEFTYDASTEPSIFCGSFGDSIKATFRNIGKRFTYGGEAPKDQRVYYFNTKEILDNKFGTPNPFEFEVVNKRLNLFRTVEVRCNGIYSYKITDPLLFYTGLSGNISYEYTREELDPQLKTEFIDALQPAFAELSALELRPAQIPAHTAELKQAVNNALRRTWTEARGISVCSIALNPIKLNDEDRAKIQKMEDAATMGSNPFMMAGREAEARAAAMEAAAANPNGAMMGFMGMNMAMGAGGGFNPMDMYNAGVQQQQQQTAQQQAQQLVNAQAQAMANAVAAAPAQNGWKCACGNTATGKFCPECGSPKPAEPEGWTCSCGAVNKGKFCPECGSRKPEGAPLYQCDKCGWKPEDPHHPPKFCPECGDLFDENDKN